MHMAGGMATIMLPPQPRWYDYINYWSLRIRDIIGGVLVFLIPPWAAYFIYEKYSTLKPAGTLAFTALMSAIWVASVVASYFVGRKKDWKG
jgi:hypothetical protein